MPLSDRLRAAVFARDKGVCAFSGLSLWLLDYATAPFGQPDWPDHIVPVSRGGKDTLDNLVCASHFYNRKKLNNGGDRRYLFRDGRPTEEFFWTHGELSETQADLLRRHACLTEPDWYFNRALFNIRVALGDETDGVDVVRDRAYWLQSAGKRLATWRKLADDPTPASFLRRGLVRFPGAPDVKLMLSLASAGDEQLAKTYKALLRHYRANRRTLEAFTRARSTQARSTLLASATQEGRATEPLLHVLQQNTRQLQKLEAPVAAD